ncbi:UNVERIFIED_CONTAM: hypothetical protein Slati_0923400 [Sesamum latifolium]|uniref:Uncharacterized protein n=1 Tax=Sesamum latifolium TaxID=2727402 RepID=A0AAW2XP74_9LAMI
MENGRDRRIEVVGRIAGRRMSEWIKKEIHHTDPSSPVHAISNHQDKCVDDGRNLTYCNGPSIPDSRQQRNTPASIANSTKKEGMTRRTVIS